MMEVEENSASPQPPRGATKIESLPCSELLPHPRKKKNKNKRRFSDEQIRSLESIFKTETKLEPRKKLQLARELGLQPRQIAIWFQNRRARWKSKQIEQDYRLLKANYDNLHTRFESLKKEKQSLLIQLQEVRDMLGKTEDPKGNTSISGGSDSEDTHHNLKTKPTCLNEGLDNGVVLYSDDEEGGNRGYFQQKEAELLNEGGQVDGSLALPEKWSNFDSTGALDQTCGSSNWWEFWS